MKIAYITAGAGGMFCGSCLHDNTLVTALIAQGHDALLIPTYTPMRTDERDVSIHRVFFGGINVFLQQKLALFRHTPRLLDRLLDGRGLLRLVSRLAVKTKAEDLGDLTVSMLKGEHGYQRKEVERLVDWLAEEVRPDIVNLTNVLLSGIVHEVKRRLRVPVLGTLPSRSIAAHPRALPGDGRLHRDEWLLRRFHGWLPRDSARAHSRRLPRPEPGRPRRTADVQRYVHHWLFRPHLPGEGLAQLGRSISHSPADARRSARPLARLRLAWR